MKYLSSEYEIFIILIINIEKTLTPKKRINLATKIFIKYHKNLKIFFQTNIDKLLKYRLYDLKIKLKPKK